MTKAEAIAKIKKLQALADPKRNANANERKSARAAIKLLKTRHGITAAGLKEPKPKKAKKARVAKSQPPDLEAMLRRAAHRAVDDLLNDLVGIFFK